MRMVYHVIEAILNAIPDSEKTHYAVLVDRLTDIAHVAKYKSPEQMPEYFQQVSDLLNNYLGEPDTEWKRKVQRIFANEP